MRVTTVALLAGLATLTTPDAGSGGTLPPMHLLWTGDATDDETTGAYDTATGLGSSIACDDVRHRLSVQFSYSRRTRTLPFHAQILPQGSHTGRLDVFRTLTPLANTWSYGHPVRACAKRYTIYVGYPDRVRVKE